MPKPTHSGTSTRGAQFDCGYPSERLKYPEESEAGAIAPSRPLPHIQPHSAVTSVTPPREHLRLCPLK